MISIILSMTKLKSLLLAFLLIQISLTAMTDLWTTNKVDQNTLICLKQNGYLQEVFVRADFDQSQQQWETYVDLSQIIQLGTMPQIVLTSNQIIGRLPAQLEAHRIYRQFEEFPVEKYWISISNFPGNFKPTCTYLKTLAYYLQLYSKKKVGIQTEPMFWKELFGSREACPQLAHYELFMSFDNFAPFGGWTSYSYFQTYQNVNACEYPGMEVFRNE